MGELSEPAPTSTTASPAQLGELSEPAVSSTAASPTQLGELLEPAMVLGEDVDTVQDEVVDCGADVPDGATNSSSAALRFLLKQAAPGDAPTGPVPPLMGSASKRPRAELRELAKPASIEVIGASCPSPPRL